jgi:D-beta-D-heptose 7-phosphate kinase/D-beta-D-heptose 1-phosphate adenosyltransferase
MARIAVVGDVMLDAYYLCNVAGFSPEDDLAPKLVAKSKTYRPGGAANVACCLRRWEDDVGLFGVCGSDYPCETLSNLLRKEELERVYLPKLSDRPTTCKTRIITEKGRQVVRVDEEKADAIPEAIAIQLAREVEAFDPDIVIFSDYAKGMASGYLMEQLNKLDVDIVVDPKTEHFYFYGPVYAITPNRKEFEAYRLRYPDGPCKSKYVIVTDAERGSFVMAVEEERLLVPKFRVPVRKREMGDPAGCGDAYIAALAHSLCEGSPLPQACLIASAAGALAFDMLGVACPSWDKVENELRNREYKEVKDASC